MISFANCVGEPKTYSFLMELTTARVNGEAEGREADIVENWRREVRKKVIYVVFSTLERLRNKEMMLSVVDSLRHTPSHSHSP